MPAEMGDRRYRETMRHRGWQPSAARVVRQLAIGCAGASLISGLLLLLQDVAPALTASVRHTWLAASALLLAGTACLGLASAVKERPKDCLLRLSLGSAFILWGIQQLLLERSVSVLLGDVVIVLFVVDLGGIIEATYRSSMRTPERNHDL